MMLELGYSKMVPIFSASNQRSPTQKTGGRLDSNGKETRKLSHNSKVIDKHYCIIRQVVNQPQIAEFPW